MPRICFVLTHVDSGTQTGLVKVYNVTTGSFLSSFSPVAPVTRRGRPPVRALAFHPHKTILYCGQQFSNIVSMFTCNEDKYRYVTHLTRMHTAKLTPP